MNIITGEQAEELYKDYLYFNRRKFCTCGEMIYNHNVVAAETEKEINGADVPTLEFFCSRPCAEQWLDNVESKKETA